MSIFPTKILLATDGSEGARLAATTAADVAERTGSELHVAYVGEVRSVYHPERHGYLARYEELREEAQRLLEGQVEQLKAAGGMVAGSHLGMGRPDEEIVVLGQEIGAGLIVTGGRGLSGIRRALMGSVSDSVVRHAHCPVMVVRGWASEFPNKILLATDGSEEARLAATTAADVAERTGSELHVVHVGEVRPVYHPAWHGYVARYEELQEEAQRLLEEQVEQVKAAGARGSDETITSYGVMGGERPAAGPSRGGSVMKESAREGLLVDGSGAPLAEEDSGIVELPDGTIVEYRAIGPENASALQRFHHRLSERSIYLRFFAAKPELSDRKAGYFTTYALLGLGCRL